MSERPPSPLRPAAALAAAVLYPFVLTRAGLLLVAWFATQFPANSTYPLSVDSTRGWSHLPRRWLDVWGRYDTGWYLDLARNGYRPTADLLHQQSNLAFFPLFSWLVRAGSLALPASARASDTGPYLVALALANVCALVGIAFVYLAVRDACGDERLARRTALYLLLFPASFFLSCAYTESLFLALAAAAFFFAQRGRWGAAAVAGFLLGLTRPSGVLVAPALALLYLSQRGWSVRALRWDALAVLAAPAGMAAHAMHLAALTGDPLALFHAQSAWRRTVATPWRTLLDPIGFHAKMGHFERASAALFLLLGAALIAMRQWAFAAFALLSLVPVLLSGTLMSATRFVAVIFPAFLPLARAGEREAIDRAVVVIFSFAQALFFLAWSRYYWVA